MGDRNNLLIEIGTEELPPKSLQRLAQALAKGLGERLVKAKLIDSERQVGWHAAPRRLVFTASDVALQQQEQRQERRGPAVAAAWDDDGAPTKATQGFARSCDVEPSQLETLATEKGQWLVFRSVRPGELTANLLPTMLAEALRQLPIDRRMRWGAGDGEFVRPVHWIVALLGSAVIEFELFGIDAGRESRGHRFHANHNVTLADADSYLQSLKQAHVVADYGVRQQLIVDQVNALATTLGGTAVMEPGLLDEVTSLVEWPNAVLGSFDKEFLRVPAEALIAAMGGHQKYFHLLDSAGDLLPNFITVANLDIADTTEIVAGNERVLRARLADARFFWDSDCKRSLNQLAEGLSAVVFQQKLGTLEQKSQRLQQLIQVVMADQQAVVGAEISPEMAAEAARLCKADLLADMVGEFPELQGVMGEYYAAAAQLPAQLGQAIREHYLPRFAGDKLPETGLGRALALTDRIDTLIGIFAIGAAPTGDKDPFALRRAALGVIRIQLEAGLDLPLLPLLTKALNFLPASVRDDTLPGQVNRFIIDRFRSYQENAGFRHDEIEAVLAVDPERLADAQARLQALQQFRSNPAAASLAAANKRVANILAKSKDPAVAAVDPDLLAEPEEQALYQALMSCGEALRPLVEGRQYVAVCQQLAGLRQVVDAFFDAVMVMAEQPELRRNRLGLLVQMRQLFLQVADFSCLQG